MTSAILVQLPPCNFLYLKFLFKVLDQSQPMDNIPEWFRGARLNFAENLLRFDDDKVALYTAGIKFSVSFIIFLTLAAPVWQGITTF